MSTEDLVATRDGSAEQRGAGGRTDGLRHVDVVKACAFGGELFHVGRLVVRIAERFKIRPAGIVQKDDDDIRRAFGFSGGREAKYSDAHECE